MSFFNLYLSDPLQISMCQLKRLAIQHQRAEHVHNLQNFLPAHSSVDITMTLCGESILDTWTYTIIVHSHSLQFLVLTIVGIVSEVQQIE